MKRLAITAFAAHLLAIPVSANGADTPPSPADPISQDGTGESLSVFISEVFSVYTTQKQAQVGETVSIWLRAAQPAGEVRDKEIHGMLRSPNGSRVIQERFLRFSYQEEEQAWKAEYTVTPYDQGGQWTMDIYGEYAAEDLMPFTIENAEPAADEEAPLLAEFLLQGKSEDASLMPEDALEIEMKAEDIGSGVRSVTVAFVDEADMETKKTISLRWTESNVWKGSLQTDASMKTGSYKILYTMVDHAGNDIHEISKRKLSIQQAEEEPETSPSVPEEQEDQTTPVVDETEAEESPPALEQVPDEETAVPAPVHPEPINPEPINPGPLNVDSLSIVNEISVQPLEKLLAAPEISGEAGQEETQMQKKQMPEKSEGPSAASLFGYVAGVFLLLSVLKHNKDWTQEG